MSRRRRWAPPGTVRPMLIGMAAFSSGLLVAVLMPPSADFVLLGVILLALALLYWRGLATVRIRRWAVLFLVGALLGTLGSLGRRYATRRGSPETIRESASPPVADSWKWQLEHA